MKRRTLVGAILRVQSRMVALACGVLVLLSLGGGMIILKRAQDHELVPLAQALCHGIASESAEGLGEAEAARDFFEESGRPDLRMEYRRRDGQLVALWEGDIGVPLGEARLWPDDAPCRSLPRATSWLMGSSLRTCRAACDTGHSVFVAAEDLRSTTSVRRLAAGLILALPLSVLLGVAASRSLTRRLLRPLGDLQQAATRLQAGQGHKLGVAAEHAELADLEGAFDRLLESLERALDRERRFAQEASHELRTPLTVLRGRLELLHPRLRRLDPELAEEARLAVREASSLARLADELLLLARSETAPMPRETVNLCDLARDAVMLQQGMAGPGVRPIELEAPEEVLVHGSEELLARALANLLENARKFSGPAGRVQIQVWDDGGRAQVLVDDDGPGVPPDLRSRAFEPFVRGADHRRHTAGAGLGLAVVRAICQRHGGEAVIEESALGGARFRLTLPLASGMAP